MNERLDFVQMAALSGTVQRGVQIVHEWACDSEATIQYYAKRAEKQLASGELTEQILDLSAGGDHATTIMLGVMACQPGGTRLFGIIFCAIHCPEGDYQPHRYSCRHCDPDAVTAGGPDSRNVITVKGDI